MIVVEECHDFGCRRIYLVGGCCVANDQGCGGLYSVMCRFGGGVIAYSIKVY